ncbi:carboxymethylenebutenolidase [Pseudonocardia hierapolitana]|uniref:Carboxymethylenebutenolidase n=1 Tax=Pseudonocardia hierapolitana TaxID=1128676 RepID=A0A561SV05_9PSEU|nr:dienelactone hydrolase family protein [Pseudonocardia hierapolitana]TWF78695.1 carboxymethylenebutenolidase [Pseudonocardia hierapolitana]
MPSSHYETITTPDGTFDAFCAVPEATPAPAVLIFQEVFGVNDNIRGLAVQLAEAGYLALAPDVFWRIEPRFERKDESGLADGFAHVQQLDFDLVPGDLTATMAHALGMPECNGRVGGVGFCLGGTLAYLFAATARVDGRGPDAVVSYYGSAINGMLDLAPRVECPVLFHYGADDPYIPAEKIDEVEQAFAGRSDVVLHRYAAGHAFSNWDAPSLYDEKAARTAWPRTVDFLGEHLR